MGIQLIQPHARPEPFIGCHCMDATFTPSAATGQVAASGRLSSAFPPFSARLAHEALPASVQSALWLGHQLGHAQAPTVPSGFAALDAELPGGGWPLAGLTELMLAEPGSGELALLAPALGRVAAQGGEVVWIGPPHIPYAPALQALGMKLDQLTWLLPADARDAAWATEQVLRSGTCAWVQWWSEKISPEVLRRLHLAALDHHCALLVLRPWAMQRHASPAPLRLTCTPLPQRRLGIQVLKRRGPASARPMALVLPDPVPHRHRPQSTGTAVPLASSLAGTHAVAGCPSAPLAA
jgi:protein ImuA